MADASLLSIVTAVVGIVLTPMGAVLLWRSRNAMNMAHAASENASAEATSVDTALRLVASVTEFNAQETRSLREDLTAETEKRREMGEIVKEMRVILDSARPIARRLRERHPTDEDALALHELLNFPVGVPN